MLDLVAVVGIVGGYVLYRKWKAAREYNQRLEPKHKRFWHFEPISPSDPEWPHGPACGCTRCEVFHGT